MCSWILTDETNELIVRSNIRHAKHTERSNPSFDIPQQIKGRNIATECPIIPTNKNNPIEEHRWIPNPDRKGKIDVLIKRDGYEEPTWEPMEVIKKDDPITLAKMQMKKALLIK